MTSILLINQIVTHQECKRGAMNVQISSVVMSKRPKLAECIGFKLWQLQRLSSISTAVVITRAAVRHISMLHSRSIQVSWHGVNKSGRVRREIGNGASGLAEAGATE